MAEIGSANDCILPGIAYGSMTLEIMMSPVQLMLLKILVSDFQLALPRHKIMLSMTLSDSVSVLFIGTSSMFLHVFSITTESTPCVVIRETMIYLGVMSTAISSLMIIALSVERYVACIHCFHIEEILSSKRINFSICLAWIIAPLISAISPSTGFRHSAQDKAGKITMIVLVAVIIPTILVIAIVQVRLFLESRKKLLNDPARCLRQPGDNNDVRKREVRVALSALKVVAAYATCTLPAAILFMYELSSLAEYPVSKVAIPLLLLGKALNPLVYGFGIADTKEALVLYFKKMRLLCSNSVANSTSS